MRNAILACLSHGPALKAIEDEPDAHRPVADAYAARARALQAFDPELIVIFAPDHYTGVHLQMTPPFCIATKAEAVSDYGGFPGALNVPEEIASRCIEAVREQGVDVAASQHLMVDHGFSQPLHWLAGALGRYPTLPVFINTTCKPVSPFARVRALGDAVGRFASTLDCRVAFVGSGGLSHHPANVFPQDLSRTPAAIADYLVYGGSRGGMDREAWLAHLGQGVVEGGRQVARGERTAEDFRLNADWDRRFLSLFAAGDLKVFDDWRPPDVIEEAGVAAIEVQNWIAAAAAAQAIGVGPPQIDFHHVSALYRVSLGVAHA